jgi:hypothetical protein
VAHFATTWYLLKTDGAQILVFLAHQIDDHLDEFIAWFFRRQQRTETDSNRQTKHSREERAASFHSTTFRAVGGDSSRLQAMVCP